MEKYRRKITQIGKMGEKIGETTQNRKLVLLLTCVRVVTQLLPKRVKSTKKFQNVLILAFETISKLQCYGFPK